MVHEKKMKDRFNYPIQLAKEAIQFGGNGAGNLGQQLLGKMLKEEITAVGKDTIVLEDDEDDAPLGKENTRVKKAPRKKQDEFILSSDDDEEDEESLWDPSAFAAESKKKSRKFKANIPSEEHDFDDNDKVHQQAHHWSLEHLGCQHQSE